MSTPRFTLCILIALAGWNGPTRADFVYSDFSDVTGLKLNGDAARVGTELRLADATDWSSGSAFTSNAIALGDENSFSTYFRFRITDAGGVSDEDGTGADGLVFVVQTVSNNVGGAGGGIGYGGISPSLGVEFDTYHNPFDPNGNHVGIDLDGSLTSQATTTETTRFNNDEVWSAWIDYNGLTNQLEVRWSMDAARPTAPQLSLVVDLAADLGQDTAFVGFTSGTGAAYGNHDILSWEYRGAFAPIGAAVPEPTSLVLLGLGAATALGGGLRRGRRFGPRRAG
jgi:hypothetical protein